MKRAAVLSNSFGPQLGHLIVNLAWGAIFLGLIAPAEAVGQQLLRGHIPPAITKLNLQPVAVERQTLRGHVPPAVARLNLQPIGQLPATNRLNLAIGLPLRNTNELARLLRDIYDPTSPQFRHYLTLEQFTERFGPTLADYQALQDFVRENGLAVSGTHPNRVLLDVAGNVSDIERTFHLTMHAYQHPKEARQFYAPDTEPSLDSAVPILHISGLENYMLPRPLGRFTPLGQAGQGTLDAGSGPRGQFISKDLRAAYAPNVALTGTGQTVGLFEMDAYFPRDIEAYEILAGLPNVGLTNVLLNGFNGPPGGFQDEVALDIQMAIAMAPGLSEVVVYEGLIPEDVLNRMATDNLAKQLSSSWTWSPFTAVYDQIFQQMAAQGQSMFSASGDYDAYGSSATPPTDDPYVTLVGGTALTMTANSQAYLSETVWQVGTFLGSSGGISSQYPLPSWQQGIDMSTNGGSTTMRNMPDVAMVATGLFTFTSNGHMGNTSGTSCAAPLWAGFTALVNQQALANGQAPVGFLNPALYAIGKSASYPANFHDVTTGNNTNPISPTKFKAVPGYDLCTGWGSPKASLIDSLATPEPLIIAAGSDLVLAGPVGGPFASTTLSLTNKSSQPISWAAGTGGGYLVDIFPTVGVFTNDQYVLSGMLAGAAATNIAILASAAAYKGPLGAGSYPATLFFTNLTDQVVQTRNVMLAVVAQPTIVAQPTNQTVMAGLSATFSIEVSPNALLQYQWQFANGTNLALLSDGFNLSGSTTPTLTISNVSLADIGAYSVVVSNIAGSVTSAPASLIVLTGQAPVIVSQPTNHTVLPGTTATFSVVAAGDAPLSYFWQFNGTNLADGGGIRGSASNTLIVANATLVSVGTYSVLVTNAVGTNVSAGAVLTVTPVTIPEVALETFYSFPGATYGSAPYAGLMQASDGKFYGTASQGGSTRQGTIFRMDTNGVVTLVHSFVNGNDDGAFPYAALIQGTNGLLYGATSPGGANNGFGTTFRVSAAGSVTTFSLNPRTTGGFPVNGLIQGADGNFYGTTTLGGLSGYSRFLGLLPEAGYGTVFRMSSSGNLTALASFNYDAGANPSSTLVQTADGSFYGTAQSGGTNGGWGTIFKMSPAGMLTALFSFSNTNGARPVAGLVRDADGSLYGTTYSGGDHGAGTVFKLDSTGAFNSLYSFSGGIDGGNPYAGLLLAGDGNLYGVTENGGIYSKGTVFRISSAGVLTTLAQFDGYQGANPEGTLVEGTDGRLYGTTYGGGAYGKGAIFRLSFPGQPRIMREPQPVTAFQGETVSFTVAAAGGLPMSYQWLKYGTNLLEGGNVSGSSSRTLTLTNVSPMDVAPYSVVVSNAYGWVTTYVRINKGTCRS